MAYGARVPQGGGFLTKGQGLQSMSINAYTAQSPNSETEQLVKKTAGGALAAGSGTAAAGASIGASIGSGTTAGASVGGGYGALIGAGVGILAYLLS